MKYLIQSFTKILLLLFTFGIVSPAQAQNVLSRAGISTTLDPLQVDALRVRNALIAHDGNPGVQNPTGSPSLVGTFNPGAKWIGIGAPVTPGNLLYGERTQWNGQAFAKALRQRSTTDTVRDAILEWGGGNATQATSEMQFRHITNPNLPTGFTRILTMTTPGNSYFGPSPVNILGIPKLGVSTTNQVGFTSVTQNNFAGLFLSTTATNNTSIIGALGIAIGGTTTGGFTAGVAGLVFANNAANTRPNYGVWGSAPISATASNTNPNTSYAGFFQGDLYFGNSYSSSDSKYKINVVPETNTLSKILSVRPVTYNYDTVRFRPLNFTSRRQHGFIAQELQAIFPELIQGARFSIKSENGAETGSDIGLAVNYTGLISVLFRGIQEQQAQINELRQRLGLPPVTAASATTLAANNQATSGAQLIADADNPAPAQRINTSVGEFTAADFKMEQNVPNPFSGNTVIRYTLPNRISNAFIGVYNLQGTQLLRFDRLNGGSQVTINASTLQPGIYIYSLVAEGQEVMSKRMVVSR